MLLIQTIANFPPKWLFTGKLGFRPKFCQFQKNHKMVKGVGVFLPKIIKVGKTTIGNVKIHRKLWNYDYFCNFLKKNLVKHSKL